MHFGGVQEGWRILRTESLSLATQNGREDSARADSGPRGDSGRWEGTPHRKPGESFGLATQNGREDSARADSGLCFRRCLTAPASSSFSLPPSRPVPSRPVQFRAVSSRAVPSFLVLSRTVLSCLVPSRPVPSRPVPSRLVPSRPVPFRPFLSSRLILPRSRPGPVQVPSRPIPFCLAPYKTKPGNPPQKKLLLRLPPPWPELARYSRRRGLL